VLRLDRHGQLGGYGRIGLIRQLDQASHRGFHEHSWSNEHDDRHGCGRSLEHDCDCGKEWHKHAVDDGRHA
jgi:hypothetical protein